MAGSLLFVTLSSHQIDDLIATYGYAAVFVIVGLESVGIPLPGETTLTLAAIYAGATQRLNIAGVILAATLGAIIGDNVGYVLGRVGGYRLLRRYGNYVRIDEHRVKIGRYLFDRHGGKVVFFGRFVALLRTYAAFLAGTMKMPWPRFLVFNAAGGIVWALVYGLGFYYFGSALTSLRAPADIALAAAAVIGVVGGIVVLRRKEKQLGVAAEQAYPGPLE
jgi:membrane protein DedA with SNARE-associated domain